MEQPNELEKQDKKKLNEDMVMFMRKRSAHDAPRYTARLKTYVDIQRKRRRAAAARRNSEHSCTTDNKTSSPTAALRKKSDEQKDKEKEAAFGLESTEPGNQQNMFGGRNMSDQPNGQDGQIGRKSRRPVGSSAKLCSIRSNSSDSVMLASQPQHRHHHHHHRSHHFQHNDETDSERGWFGKRGGADEKPTRGRSGSRSHSDELSDRCCRRRRRSCRRRRRRSCRRRRRRRSCRRRRRRCRRRRRSCRRRRRRRR